MLDVETGKIICPDESAIKPDFNSISETLKAIPQWVTWKYAPPHTAGGKPRKLPCDPKTGDPASVTDKSTWSTFEAAQAAYERGGFAGVGIVLTVDLGIVGIDIDHVVDPATGTVLAEARQLVEELDSYSEVSPSGTGLRIFAKGNLLPKAWRKQEDAFGLGTGLEMYDSGRYLTVTGTGVPCTPVKSIESRQPQIDAILARFEALAAKIPADPRRLVVQVKHALKAQKARWQRLPVGRLAEDMGSGHDLAKIVR